MPNIYGLAFLYPADHGTIFIWFAGLVETDDGLGGGITFALSCTECVIPECLIRSIYASVGNTSTLVRRYALTSIEYKPILALAGLHARIRTQWLYNVIIACLGAGACTQFVHTIFRAGEI